MVCTVPSCIGVVYYITGLEVIGMISKAKREANNRWDRDHMRSLSCRVRREYAEEVRAACAARGDSVSGVIRRALDAYLEDYKRGSDD